MGAVESGERTLLIKPGALGDTVLALPLVRALRLAGGPVDVMGRADFWPVARQPGYADRVLSLDGLDLSPLFAAERDLPAPSPLRQFLTGYRRVVAFWQRDAERFAAGLRRAGVSEVVGGRPLGPRPFPGDGPGHACDHLLAAVPGLPQVEPVPRFVPSARDLAQAAKLATPPYFVLHPGSGSPAKSWARGLEAIGPLSRALGLPAVVSIGPADASWAQRLDGMSLDRPPVVIRDAPIRVLGAVLSRAAVYVGSDSGVTHLAAAAGAPVVAIFGPTDPRIWAPRGRRVRILRSADRRMMRTPGVDRVVAAAQAEKWRVESEECRVKSAE